MTARGLFGLVLTSLLCLPSLTAGVVLVFNSVLHSRLEEWGQSSSAIVALAVFLGGPLVALAAVVGGLSVFSRTLPVKVKYAHFLIVSLAALSTLGLWWRFEI